jgi:hypothetical protein
MKELPLDKSVCRGNDMLGVFPRSGFSCDDRFFAGLAGDCQVGVWELASGKVIRLISTTGVERNKRSRHSAGAGAAFVSPTRLLAVIDDGGAVGFWDWARGLRVMEADRCPADPMFLAVSGRGNYLAIPMVDTRVRVWEMSRLWHGSRRAPSEDISFEEVQKLWRDLGDPNATNAYKAVSRLVDSPNQSMKLLANKLSAATIFPEREIRRRVEDLGSNSFATRREAKEWLSTVGDQAFQPLREILANSTDPEQQEAIKVLMAGLGSWSSDQLKNDRAIYCLEQVATEDAMEILGRLAKGAPQDRLTARAVDAVNRLRQTRSDRSNR